MNIEQEREAFVEFMEEKFPDYSTECFGETYFPVRKESMYMWLGWQARAAKVPKKRSACVYTASSSYAGIGMIPPHDEYKEKFNEGWNAAIDAMLNKEGS